MRKTVRHRPTLHKNTQQQRKWWSVSCAMMHLVSVLRNCTGKCWEKGKNTFRTNSASKEKQYCCKCPTAARCHQVECGPPIVDIPYERLFIICRELSLQPHPPSVNDAIRVFLYQWLSSRLTHRYSQSGLTLPSPWQPCGPIECARACRGMQMTVLREELRKHERDGRRW